MYIDFSSKPPIAEFADKGTHMANYNRVYESTKKETQTSRADTQAALQRYLDDQMRAEVRKPQRPRGPETALDSNRYE